MCIRDRLEGITGVASVTVSGTVERQLHVILSQKKLDALSQRLSDAIAKHLDLSLIHIFIS